LACGEAKTVAGLSASETRRRRCRVDATAPGFDCPSYPPLSIFSTVIASASGVATDSDDGFASVEPPYPRQRSGFASIAPVRLAAEMSFASH